MCKGPHAVTSKYTRVGAEGAGQCSVRPAWQPGRPLGGNGPPRPRLSRCLRPQGGEKVTWEARMPKYQVRRVTPEATPVIPVEETGPFTRPEQGSWQIGNPRLLAYSLPPAPLTAPARIPRNQLHVLYVRLPCGPETPLGQGFPPARLGPSQTQGGTSRCALGGRVWRGPASLGPEPSGLGVAGPPGPRSPPPSAPLPTGKSQCLLQRPGH